MASSGRLPSFVGLRPRHRRGMAGGLLFWVHRLALQVAAQVADRTGQRFYRASRRANTLFHCGALDDASLLSFGSCVADLLVGELRALCASSPLNSAPIRMA